MRRTTGRRLGKNGRQRSTDRPGRTGRLWYTSCMPYKDPEARRAYARRWRAANPEYARQYSVANRERLVEYNRRWRAENPEYIREWRAANLDRVRASSRRWAEANPEYVRQWREANPERYRKTGRKSSALRRARKSGAARTEHVDSLVVLESHNYICEICGESVDPLDFHVDHIVPLSRGGDHSYANTQPAHPFCNISKGSKLPEEV